MATYKVGDVAQLNMNRIGRIRWLGKAKNFGSGDWCGIELDEKKGWSDGESKGHCFFKCGFGFGVYVPVRMIEHKIVNTNKFNKKRKMTDDREKNNNKNPKKIVLEVEDDHTLYHQLRNNNHIDNERKQNPTTIASNVTSAFYTVAQLVVCGYIRTETSSVRAIQFPMDVINLCLQYYCRQFTQIQSELLHYQLQTRSEIEKIRLCKAQCDFDFDDIESLYFDHNWNVIQVLYFDDMQTIINKKAKLLNDIIDYPMRHLFQESWFEAILQTVTANLCRDLKHQIDGPVTDDMFNLQIKPYADINKRPVQELNQYIHVFDPTKINENSWCHLELIYDLFWTTIAQKHVPIDIITKYITGQVLKDLVQVFHSKYHLERTYLTRVFLNMFSRCSTVKPWVMELFGVFGSYLYNEKWNGNIDGVSEILFILWNLIPTVNAPIERRCLSFLYVLRGKQLDGLGSKLEKCIIRFIDIDANVCFDILQALMENWPSDVNDENTSVFLQLIFVVIIKINENVLSERISMDKFDESADLFDLMMDRLCKCVWPLPDNLDTRNAALGLFSRKEMRTFIAFAAREHIPKIVKIFGNVWEVFPDPTNCRKLQCIENIKMSYVKMGLKFN